jgi:hypothetical protein
MTRILLTIVSSFSLSLFANAQFTKGSVLIGGSVSFSSNQSNSDYTPGKSGAKNGNFNISLGKAVRENAVFGMFVNYQYYEYTYGIPNGPSKSSSNGYGIGVFYRLYKDLGKEFYLFGEAGGGYQGSNLSGYDSSGNKVSTGNSNGGQIYLYPGIAYKISKKFIVELSIPQLFNVNYSNTKYKSGGATVSTNDNFYVNANLNSNPLSSLGFGFRLLL